MNPDAPQICPKPIFSVIRELSPYSGILWYKSFRIKDRVGLFPLTL